MNNPNQANLFNTRTPEQLEEALRPQFRPPRALLNREDMNVVPPTPVDLINAQFINGAIKMLEKAGALYKIKDKYGAHYGTLVLQEEVPPKKPRKKRVARYPRGELLNFYEQYLEMHIGVGEQFYVPTGNYPAEHIRSAVCNSLTKVWGVKSYNTRVDGDLVLVTRLK
jgi:hypothetical protein